MKKILSETMRNIRCIIASKPRGVFVFTVVGAAALAVMSAVSIISGDPYFSVLFCMLNAVSGGGYLYYYTRSKLTATSVYQKNLYTVVMPFGISLSGAVYTVLNLITVGVVCIISPENHSEIMSSASVQLACMPVLYLIYAVMNLMFIRSGKGFAAAYLLYITFSVVGENIMTGVFTELTQKNINSAVISYGQAVGINLLSLAVLAAAARAVCVYWYNKDSFDLYLPETVMKTARSFNS